MTWLGQKHKAKLSKQCYFWRNESKTPLKKNILKELWLLKRPIMVFVHFMKIWSLYDSAEFSHTYQGEKPLVLPFKFLKQWHFHFTYSKSKSKQILFILSVLKYQCIEKDTLEQRLKYIYSFFCWILVVVISLFMNH